MIVIGIPNCIFLLNKFHQEVKDHGNKIKAISRVIAKVGNATFLTNLTTALGFSTFMFTNSEKLVEFGTTASLNIMFVFILSICIIPILFSITKHPKTRHLKHLEKKFSVTIVNKLVYITTTHRKRIYAVTIVIVAIAIFGATKMEATGNLTSDLPETDPILKDIHFIQDNFNGAIPFEILINYKKDARKFDRSTLQKVETIQDNINEDPQFSKSISIVNFMKLINMAYYGNNPDMYKLIERRDMLRLKSYVDNFQADMINTQKVYQFQDSIRIGKENYSDSIMLNYPKVALTVMDFKPESLNNDSIPPAKIPSKENVKAYLTDNNNISNEVLTVSEKVFPASAVGLSLKELVDTSNTTYRLRMQIVDLGSYEI